MGQAQINVRTRACSRTSIARTKQAALTHNVRGKELKSKKIKSLYLFFTFENDARKFVSDRTKSEVGFFECWKSVKFCPTTWYS